jgi:transketolase
MALTSQRGAYGEELVAICKENKNVVVLDADLCGGTQTAMVEKATPAQFIEMGIGEANMVAVSAGLALSGKHPVANSFAIFIAGRPYEQIRQSICLPGLGATFVGASCGVSDFADGATHQCFEDMALMRVLPSMTVFSPADATEARKAIRAATAMNTPTYIRINRNELPDIITKDTPFEIGKPAVMADGSDIALCATGSMLNIALEARKALSAKGVSAKVLNFATIKPLDAAAVRAALGTCSRIVSVEEHSIIGGLGTALLEALAENPVPVKRIGIMDKFGESAENYEKILGAYGLTVDNVAGTAAAFKK